MSRLRFYAEFFTNTPDREPMFPELVGSCKTWDDARKSAIDFAQTDSTVRRLQIEIDGKSATWVRQEAGWEQAI
jgi:hypothetical protein